MLTAERMQVLLSVPAALAALTILVTAVRLNFARGGRERAHTADEPAVPGLTERILRAAGIGVPPFLFHTFSMVFAAVVALVVVELSHGLLIAGLLTMLGVLYLIYSVVVDLGRRRTRRMEEKLVDAIDIMAATMRGSDNPRAALAGAADIAPQPVAGELGEIVRRLDLGMPIRRALLRLRTGYDCEGVRLFTSTLAAKWSAGGDLSPTLAAVNRVIRERLRHRLRVRSQLAGARTAAWMVAACPYLAMAAIAWLHPEWLARLFSHFYGPLLFWVAIGLQIIGFLWLKRMMRTES